MQIEHFQKVGTLTISAQEMSKKKANPFCMIIIMPNDCQITRNQESNSH